MRLSRSAVWLAFAGCGLAAPAAPPAPARATRSIGELVARPDAWTGQTVTVRAYLIGTMAGCADVLCPPEHDCCSCSVEQRLGARPDVADAEQLLYFEPPKGATLECRVRDTCEIDCTPPSSTALDVTGTLRPVENTVFHYLAIDHVAVAP